MNIKNLPFKEKYFIIQIENIKNKEDNIWQT